MSDIAGYQHIGNDLIYPSGGYTGLYIAAAIGELGIETGRAPQLDEKRRLLPNGVTRIRLIPQPGITDPVEAVVSKVNLWLKGMRSEPDRPIE